MAAKRREPEQPEWTEVEAHEAWPITRREAEAREAEALRARLVEIEAREAVLRGDVAPPSSYALAMGRPSFREREESRQAREQWEVDRERALETMTPSAYERTVGVPLPSSVLAPHVERAMRKELKSRETEPTLISAAPVYAEYEPRTPRALPTPYVERVYPDEQADTERGMVLPSSARTLVPVTARAGVLRRTPAPAPHDLDETPKYVREVRAQAAKALESRPWKAEEHDCKRASLLRALKATGGNKRAAARRMGMTRDGFYKALARVGLPTVGSVV